MAKNRTTKTTAPHDKSHIFWISVSDLLAATVFIFLIVLAIFSLQFEYEQQRFENTKAVLKSSVQTRERVLYDLQKKLKAQGLESEVISAQGILRIPNELVHFPPSEAMPARQNFQAIGALSRVLADVIPCVTNQKPSIAMDSELPQWCWNQNTTKLDSKEDVCDQNNLGKIDTIMIEGHTDPTPVKASASYPNNLTLSAMRASNVWNLIKSCQPNLEELYNTADKKIFAVSGYAYLRPAYKDVKDPRNRRIDIRFIMEQPKEAFMTESVAKISNALRAGDDQSQANSKL